MSPFSIFFAHLVDLLGAEKAAQLVHEFAGQTLQFPITGHYSELVTRVVTKRMTIFFNGVEYDVSRLPEAAIGEVITVAVANLKPLDPDRFACAAGPLRVNNHGDETSPTAADLQGQLHAGAPLAACRRAEAAPLHQLAHSPEGAECPAPCKTQAPLPLHEMQSEVRPADPASVDRS